MDDGHTAWLDGELFTCNLADERLTKRLHKLLEQIGGAMGQSIPFACQDWANAKGAYLRIPTKPAGYSRAKPAMHSNLIAATLPI